MRIGLSIFGLVMGLTLTACGSKNDSKQDAPAPEMSTSEKAELEEKYASIPSTAIVRIEVDANGNAIGEPEMRIVDTGDAPGSDDAVVAAFEKGKAPEKLVASEAELDGDSSTQSWHSWNRCHSRCGSSWGHNYWFGSYVPRLYYASYQWQYQRNRYCRRGSFNYYSYGSYRNW